MKDSKNNIFVFQCNNMSGKVETADRIFLDRIAGVAFL